MEETIYISPIGPLHISADENGIISIEYVSKREKPISIKNKHIRQCVRELDEYFKGKIKKFTVQLNLNGTVFQKRVWHALQKIPYGVTCSYKDIAHAIGKPNTVRAVGSANGKNPIPIIVPCHRVIAHDGKIGGYSGGVSKKESLLAHENSLK